MISRVSFENRTGYKLKITYDEKAYILECTERVFIPINPSESKLVKISIDETCFFDKIMFASRKSEILTLDRVNILCYITKFDMLFYDKDITTHKIEIKQYLRRFEYDVVFALLTLDVNIPVKYNFCDKNQERKFKAFNILNQVPIQFFYFICGISLICTLFTGLELVNLFLTLVGAGFIALFISNIKKRHKLIRFNKYFKDILMLDSVPCLPLKIRKRTIIFNDEE